MRHLLALIALAATAAAPRVSRADLLSVERSFNQSLMSFNAGDPIDLLGPTRGVYLEKYGVVFSAEVGLVVVPAATPFRPKPGKEELERLRQRKMARLPQFRQLMRDMLVNSGNALKTLPADEQVVVGVTFFAHSFEDTTGLPAQILMQAQRKTLVDFEAGRIGRNALQAAIQETVF
jgi:hypothetical protein